MRAHLIVVAVVGALALAGCGGSSDEPPARSTTPKAAGSTSADPVETATCKSTVKPLLELFDVMRTEGGAGGITQSSFGPRFQRLQDGQDDVTANCTNAVGQPYAKAIYDMSLVNAALLTCNTAAACDKAGVPAHLQDALAQQAAIQSALDATR